MRARKLAANRAHVAATAMRLFAERGYEDVTVDEIAEVADVGLRTVHRYFPRKSDLVFAQADHYAELIGRAVAGMPASGPLAAAVFGMVRAVVEAWPQSREDTLDFVRVVAGSPELRAREHAKRADVRRELFDSLAQRRPDDTDADRHLWSTIAVTLFFLALDSWMETGGEFTDHYDRLLDDTRKGFAA